jgi:hypothetical protein
MRGQRECHECSAPHWLELQRAAHLLDRAAHHSDALQAVLLGQQGFVDNDRLCVSNDDDALLPEKPSGAGLLASDDSALRRA